MNISSKFIVIGLLSVQIGLTSAHAIADSVPVKFKSSSSETYSGKIKGYRHIDYRFRAKKGQTLKVETIGHVETYLMSKFLPNSINLNKYSPDLTNGRYVFPATGLYVIRVGQTRAAAFQNRTPNYTLHINIQ